MPAEDYVVESVAESYPNPDHPCWEVYFRKPDGSLHGYMFPQDSLEWRAAEYGIDPGDVDTLLDIVLHEPFIRTGKDDPALVEGRVSRAVTPDGNSPVGDWVPTNLFNAETIQDAREAQMVRIQYAKANRVTVISPKGKVDPLEKIRAGHRNRVNRIDEKRAEVQKTRAYFNQVRTEAIQKKTRKEK